SFYSFVPVADEDFVVDKKCSSIADIDKDVYPTDLHTFFLAAEKVSGLQRSSDSPLTEQRLPESLEFESHELQRVGHQDNVGMSFGFPVMMQDYGTYPSVEPKFSVLEDGGEMASSVPRKQKRKRKSKSLEAMYAELKKAKFHNIHELRRKYFKLD
ncbi:hypothetical protein TTRE_0000862401, partial [Trichuris trichiura]